MVRQTIRDGWEAARAWLFGDNPSPETPPNGRKGFYVGQERAFAADAAEDQGAADAEKRHFGEAVLKNLDGT